MSDLFQKTLKQEVIFEGHGLHSGLKSLLKILPADEDFGIYFKRSDLEKNNLIKADYRNVNSAQLCTTLQNEHGVSVSTVEHLLAALYIVGVDNALIEINSSEIPIMDGSSKDFIDELLKVGTKELKSKRKFLKVIKKFEYKNEEKFVSIEPTENNEFKVDFELNYKNSLIGNQRNQINFSSSNLQEVYSSRTFCLFEDIEKIKKIGLAKGGSLDNAVVVKDNTILNTGGLRNDKEFVNHKILDLAGDFVLSGYRIIGDVKCAQGGHSLSNLFLRAFLSDKSNYLVSELEPKVIIKTLNKDSESKLAVNA